MSGSDPAGQRPQSVPSPGYLRVAAIQIDFQPALDDYIDDPLWEGGRRDKHSLLPRNETWLPVVRERYKALRQRLRAQYVEHHTARLLEVLQACRILGVHAIVLPEYSVPHEALVTLAQAQPEILIVAGTHLVGLAARGSGVYERLGAETPAHNTAVCPVLYDGRILQLVSKLSASQHELALDLHRGSEWKPIEGLPEPVGTFGVLVCLDFLDEENAIWQQFVAGHIGRCGWLAVPSLTSTRSTRREFSNTATEHSERYKRPTVHANRAREGGSCVYADAERGDSAPTSLPADQEAVLIVDIDVKDPRPGTSTPYHARQAVRTFTRATFVYPSVEPDYAAWFHDWSAQLRCPGEEGTTLEALVHWLEGNPPPTEGASALRQERLRWLVQERERWRTLQQVEGLTHEIVLSEDTLPPALLRAALARGAGEQVDSWRRMLEGNACTEAAIVADTLRSGGQKLTLKVRSDSPRALAIVDRVAATVRGEIPGTAGLRALVGIAIGKVDGDLERSKELFNRGDYEGVLASLTQVIAHLEAALSEGADQKELAAQLARSRLMAAAAAVNVGDRAEAHALVERIQVESLRQPHRITLADIFLGLGDVERAHQVLPEPNELSTEDDLRHRQAVEQSIAIFQGRAPGEAPVNATVELRLAVAAFERNDLDACSAAACRVLEREDATPVERCLTADLLGAALARSVDPESKDSNGETVQLISEPHRERVVQVLERAFENLRSVNVLGAVERRLRTTETAFRMLVMDQDQFTEQHALDEEAAPLEAAWEAARAGNLLAALSMAPTIDHPWRNELLQAELTALAGALADALLRVEALRDRFPRRPHIERVFAMLCMRLGRTDDALAALRIAKETLPGVGQSLDLAQMLWGLERYEDAAAVLEPLRGDLRPRVLRTRARVLARLGNLAEAEQCYRSYLERKGDDALAHLELARLLWTQHNLPEAADVAWTAFEQAPDSFDARALAFIGGSQERGGTVEAVRKERLRRVDLALQNRRAADPDAEGVRAALLLRSGEPLEDFAPFDFETLERHGQAMRFSIDDLKPMLATQRQMAELAKELYRTGQIGLSASLGLRNFRLAEYAEVAIRSRADEAGLICPAFDTTDGAPRDLSGAELVVTALEVTLLARLELMDDLRTALGEHGRLLLTEDDWDRIVAEASAFPRRAGDPLRERVQTVVSGLVESASEHDGAAIGNDASLQAAGTADFARWLEREGIIDGQQAARLAGKAESPASIPETPPGLHAAGAISLGLDVIRALVEYNLDEIVLGALKSGTKITAARNARATLDRQRLEEEIQKSAAQLADRVHERLARGLTEGWVGLTRPPDTSDAPGPRDNAPPSFTSLFVEPLRDALGLARLARKGDRKLRLNAEFSTTLAPATYDTVLGFAWRDKEHYSEVANELREAAERDIHFPELVRRIVPDAERCLRALETLAELGFPDALDADEIVDLGRRFEAGVDAPRARHLLGRIEWIARDARHVGNPLATLRLTGVYAKAVFAVSCGSDGNSPPPWSDFKRRAFVHGLLIRLEEVGATSGKDVLRLALSFLALEAVNVPTASWAPSTSSSYSLDPDSSAARMWDTVYTWVASSTSRRAAYSRALAFAWLWVDDAGATNLARLKRDVGTLWHAAASMADAEAARVARGELGTPFFDLAPVEAVAILSGSWDEEVRPLRTSELVFHSAEGAPGATQEEHTMSAEEALQRGADALGRRQDLLRDATRLGFPLLIPTSDGVRRVRMTAPIEAILLRVQDEQVVQHAASTWRRYQGPHDGEAYVLLTELASDPANPEKRRTLARHAITSLWRLVRSDPGYLLQWRWETWARPDHRDDPHEELCALLSEPMAGLPKGSVWAGLFERFEQGAWKDRVDRVDLILLAGSLPGTTALYAAQSLLESDQVDAHVSEAFARLGQHQEQPVGLLTRDVFLLRLAAARRQEYVVEGRKIELARELPGALARLIDDLDSNVVASQSASLGSGGDLVEPSTPGRSSVRGTLAAAEPALLRVCAAVVRSVTPMQTDRWRLWLGWRLYGWLVAQLNYIGHGDGGTRADAMHDLTRGAPAPIRDLLDPLDPFGFDGQYFNHRLASVIHALALGERFVSSSHETGPTDPLPLWSSAVIEDRLVAIGDRYSSPGPTSDLLDWQAPANLPDLALWALLALNVRAFERLTPETRRRAIARIPDQLGDRGSWHREFASGILHACTLAIATLDPVARRELEIKVRSLENTPETQRWLRATLTALYSTGETHLRDEIEALLLEHADTDESAGLISLLLSAEEATALPSRVRHLLSLAQAKSRPLNVWLLGLGRLCVHASEEKRTAARQLLAELALEGPFKDDPAVSDLLHALGIARGGK